MLTAADRVCGIGATSTRKPLGSTVFVYSVSGME
jgi:hypothetical protein